MFFSVVNSKFRSIVTVIPYGSRSIPYGLYVEIQEWHTHSHSSSPSLVALQPPPGCRPYGARCVQAKWTGVIPFLRF